jgi:hypothetical protein
MNFFAIWFEKHFCKIQKGHGSNVGKILNLLNATSMTLFLKFDSKRSLARMTSPTLLSTSSLTSHF